MFLVAICLVIPKRMRVSGSYGDMGSRDVIGHVAIRLPGVDFLGVVHSDHASI